MKPITDWSLCDTASAIATRKVSALEVAEATLARIAAHQPKLNAFVRIDTTDALAAAKAADQALAAGQHIGPLHGVPLAHKDMFYRPGLPRHVRLGHPARLRARHSFHSAGAARRCWRHHRWRAQHVGVRQRADGAQCPLRADAQPLEYRAYHWRLVDRVGDRCRGPARLRLARLRYGWIHPAAGRHLRRLRH